MIKKEENTRYNSYKEGHRSQILPFLVISLQILNKGFITRMLMINGSQIKYDTLFVLKVVYE